MIIEDFQKLTVSLRGNLDVKTNIIVFTFKGQLDAFSEKQFKNFVTNNLKNDLPFVIDLTKIDFLDSSGLGALVQTCLLYTSPSPRDCLLSRMPSSA